MDKISKNPRVQQDYEEMISAGTSPKLAEMLALQSPPHCQTDTRFMTGEHSGSRYSSQLARFPGDPEAYVSSRGDVLRVAKKRGLKIEGTYGMNYTPSDYGDAPIDKPYEVADDIVDAAVQEIADEHPEALHDKDLQSTLKKQFSGDAD
jgi:hypothetical protein